MESASRHLCILFASCVVEKQLTFQFQLFNRNLRKDTYFWSLSLLSNFEERTSRTHRQTFRDHEH